MIEELKNPNINQTIHGDKTKFVGKGNTKTVPIALALILEMNSAITESNMSFAYPNRRKAMKLNVIVLTRGRNQDAIGAEWKLSWTLDDRGVLGLANDVLGRRRSGALRVKLIGRSSLSSSPF